MHQATGFIGAGLDVPLDDALMLLRREAQRLDVDLSVLAADIVKRRRRLPTTE